MDSPALHGVDAGGVYAGVAQNVRQPGQVLFQCVIGPGEQVAQVVGKDFSRLHPGAVAELFHVPPDVRAIQGLSRPGGEYRIFDVRRLGGLFLCLEVCSQQAAQLVREKDGTPLALVGDLRPARLHGLHGDTFQLAHPDAGGADGLQDQSEAPVAVQLRRPDQPDVLAPGQLPALVTERRLLNVQQLHGALPPAHEAQKAVDSGDHAVDRGRGVALGQFLLPADQGGLGNGPLRQMAAQGLQVPDVLFNGAVRPLILPQMKDIAAEQAGGEFVAFWFHSGISFGVQISLLYRIRGT